MRRGIYFAVLCLSSISTAQAQQGFQTKYFRNGMYFFDDTDKYTKTSLASTHKQEFGLGFEDSLALRFNVTDSTGRFDCKYEQYHKGVRVEGAALFIHGDKEIALCANSRLIKNLNISTTTTISETDARQTAINFIGATQFIWQDSLREAIIKEESGDPTATNLPKGQLMIIKSHTTPQTDDPSNFSRCYKFTIEALIPSSTTDVYVDAQTNTVFTTQSATYDDWGATGTGWTWYYGWFNNLKTSSCNILCAYYLKDRDRNIETRDSDGEYYKDGDNDWVGTNEKNGASAHWAMARAWDYYKNRFERNGTDFANKRIKIIAGDPGLKLGATAGWNFDGGVDNIKLRPNRSTDPISAAALDIIGHELTHGMHHATSELGGNKADFEAASMNEGFADLMGVCAEGRTLGTYDWSMGEKSGTYQRRFDNPRLDWGMHTSSGASPDTYMGPDWLPLYDEGLYSNTGVWRKWFYLTVNGGTHNFIGVPGMGITRSEGLVYLASNWWFWANLKHTEAASQLENAVKYYTKECSSDHKNVARALRAAGFMHIAIPSCMKLVLGGDRVIRQSDANTRPIFFKAEINDMPPGGTFTWHIPAGWIAMSQGNTLTVTHVADFNSKMLSVTYTSPNVETSSDSMSVHFSDEIWFPENAPAESFYKKTNPVAPIVDDKIAVFPNPAKHEVNIHFETADENSQVDIIDISGRVIGTYPLKQQKNKIALPGLQQGMFLLRIQHNGYIQVRKITLIH